MQYIIKCISKLFQNFKYLIIKYREYRFYRLWGIYRKDMTEDEKELFDYFYNSNNIDYSDL